MESGVAVASSTGQSIIKIVGMVGELAEAMMTLSGVLRADAGDSARSAWR
ncbi:hypothetical protein WDV93_22965 [Pantoea ananatis]